MDLFKIREKITEFFKVNYPNISYDKFDNVTLYIDLLTLIYQDSLYNVDFNYNESFINSAIADENIIRLLQEKGLNLNLIYPANVLMEIYFTIPSINYSNYMPIIKAGTTIGDDIKFELLEDINTLTYSDKEIVKGDNETYIKLNNVKFVAGETKIHRVTVTDSSKYWKLNLVDDNIIDVLNIVDSNGNTYYKVSTLAQDYIFQYTTVNNIDDVTYSIDIKKIPYRFMVRYNDVDSVDIIFGNEYDENDFYDNVINPYKLFGSNIDFNNDNNNEIFTINNLMYTPSMGIVPKNGTELFIKYRVGYGTESNVEASSIDSFSNLILDFNNNISTEDKNKIFDSFTCINPNSSVNGGYLLEDKDKLRLLLTSMLFAQDRCITKEDYESMLYKFPQSFGKIGTCKINVDGNIVNIYVLSKYNNSFIQSSQTLKDNIKKYLSFYSPINTEINVEDAEIINLGISVGLVLNNDVNKSETVSKILVDLYTYVYSLDKSKPIIISKIYDFLHNFSEILSVSDIKFNIVSVTSPIGNWNTILNRTNRYFKNGMLFMPDNFIWQIDKENVYLEI